MRKFILIAFTFINLGVSAQYFQHEYGGAQSQLSFGMNTQIHPPGHVLVGNNSSSGANDLVVTYTDPFGTPYFNNIYPSVGGMSSQIVETPNGFGVIGTGTDVFYMPISLTGTPGPISSYPTVGAAGVIFATAATTSASGNDIYITGTAYNTGGGIIMFIIKIDTNGNLIWSNIYDVIGPYSGPSFDRPFDIIESPYTPTGATEVIVVGGIVDNNGGASPNMLGYLMRVNANTGTMIGPWPVVFYAGTNEKSYLTSIEVANSPSLGGAGFILSGADDNTGKNDFWVMKTDPIGSIQWSNTYDYGLMPGYAGISYAAIERQNTSGNYEYYATGFVGDPNKVNVEDVVVQKIDDMGNPFPQGEFTYFGLNGTDAEIDQFNGTPYDGLSIFCSRSISPGSSEMYLVKAYFNGRSGCNETFSDPDPNSGPDIYGEGNAILSGSFGFTPLPPPGIIPTSNNQVCYSTTLPDGNNARVAPEEPEGENEVTISPNPFSAGTHYAGLEVEVNEPTAVTVSIYDVLGRSYYTHSFNLVKGKNNLTLDISKANMATGMYSIRVQGKTYNKTIMLMVK